MIVVTGGSGKLGRFVVEDLAAHGHEVVNIDTAPPPAGAKGRYVHTDITDFGQVIAALAGIDERTREVRGIVHLAAIPAPGRAPNQVVFNVNTQSTYNVFEAARQLCIRNIVSASSETVFGVPFTEGTEPSQVPLDESVTVPHSSYALSKLVGETMAGHFCRLDPALKIVSLRFSNVLVGADYDRIRTESDPASRRFNCWTYIDARDGATAARLALEATITGHHVLGIANADSIMEADNDALMDQFFPGTPRVGTYGPRESLISIAAARRLLGFEPRHSWRKPSGS
ncbi:NAD(P)-dependent oxidoreductase [Alsobacter sp. SYSU M60028]|uniref:NAD(P)-dependent oxidoreductase n=1 Tax=Alsobacter ponti TaxID=2962936 RepID=A0ABT1L902_9HYPH|nr:NAD(P)-dependent oxidoreductase [Alsobacter ponti]MCP8937418.1 NAD(P)-dependent oxidoreductase [Alsobacter ponti]